MTIYPAIDLWEGQVVRLKKGDFNLKTVYSDDPAAFAKKWSSEGAEWIHVVDLEGAKTGILKNRESVLRIRKSTSCKIQLGGGMRSHEIIREMLDLGIDRVVCGTKALNYEFLEKSVNEYGPRLAIGLDVRDGIIQTEGWLSGKNPTLQDALDVFKKLPLETVIYTDIQKDGMLEGPDWDGLKKVLSQTQAKVILSGGVSNLADIKKAHSIHAENFEGMIIGKALYDGKINLKEALELKTHD